MPDTFKETADVVVEGKYLGDEKFVATVVLATGAAAAGFLRKLDMILPKISGLCP